MQTNVFYYIYRAPLRLYHEVQYANTSCLKNVSLDLLFIFLNNSEKSTDFTNYMCKTFWRNLTQESYKLTHLTYKLLAHYLENCNKKLSWCWQTLKVIESATIL